MTTTAMIVVAASKLVERAGPVLGAMVATLASLATNAATFGFGALYALLARKQSLPIAFLHGAPLKTAARH